MIPRVLLISLRDPQDPMAIHERRCFADRCQVPLEAVTVFSMMEGKPDLGWVGEFDAILFGGSGSYSVLDPLEWIQNGIRLCEQVANLAMPAFASCFGFQGLAVALGGQVIRDDSRTELGATWLHLTDAGKIDPLFSCLPATFSAQEGHHDHVVKLPESITLLASGDVSYYQAFRVNGAPFWASQFHPELTSKTASARFRYYAEHYSDPSSDQQAIIARLEAGQDTPELESLLTKLVRWKSCFHPPTDSRS